MWHKTYKAQVLDMGHGVQHIKIQRHDGKPIRCNWDVLQRIKNDMVGEAAYAVEVYPEESRVMNETNMRHLWVLPERLPIGW